MSGQPASLASRSVHPQHSMCCRITSRASGRRWRTPSISETHARVGLDRRTLLVQVDPQPLARRAQTRAILRLMLAQVVRGARPAEPVRTRHFEDRGVDSHLGPRTQARRIDEVRGRFPLLCQGGPKLAAQAEPGCCRGHQLKTTTARQTAGTVMRRVGLDHGCLWVTAALCRRTRLSARWFAGRYKFSFGPVTRNLAAPLPRAASIPRILDLFNAAHKPDLFTASFTGQGF